MAEVNATFNYDADFSSAVSEVKRLSKELSVLNASFNSLDRNANVLRNDIAKTFSGALGQIGGFSAKTVDITSNIDNFGKSLDRGKLKLRDYYREATRAFQANSNAQKLAEDQIRRTRSSLIQLGIDPSGRSKGMLVTPLKLDMSDMNNQLAVARKQFDIFNALVQGGATKLINFGKNTQWAGRQLTVGITVPMSIFASTVTKAFMDVDAELTRFQKVYGSGLVASTAESTAAIRGQVTAMATEIAGKYGVAAKETAGLAADLAATGLEGQNLINSLKETTRLSVLGEVDRQTAMKATLAIQNAFKVNTKELADNINFLNAVENQTSTSLQDLTEAIPKAGPVIKALGGDVKDLSLLLVAMKEGGIGVGEGANAIKSGLASLINPTKAAIEVGKAYGINIEEIVRANKGQLMPTIIEFQNSLNTLDEFGKAQVIEKIFGKYQFARMAALFDNLNASGSQTKKVLELMSASNSQLAAIANQEIKTLTESASMRFKRSMESIKASLLPVGQTILTSVLPYLEKFSSFIDRVIEVGKSLPEPVKQFIKFGSAITAIAGPLVMIGGVLANFLGYVTKGAMGFVNLGRRMAGLPTQQFSMLDDTQIAAAKATDILTHSLDKQKNTMIPLVALMRDYVATLNAQRAATPGAFIPGGVGAKPTKPIKRQSGGSAWVPGSGSGDKIPALLEPGEFVVNRNAAKQNGGLLTAMNNSIPRFQNGGVPQSRNEFLDMLFAGQIKDMEHVDEMAAKFGISLNRTSTGNPAGPLARIISESKGYSTYSDELALIYKYISDPEKRKNWSQMSGSHITKDSFTAGDQSGKVWRGDNLSPDLQIINQVVEDLGIPTHPTTRAEAQTLIGKIKSSNHKYKDLAAQILQVRLGGNYYEYTAERRNLLKTATLRQGAYKGEAPIGITSQYFRNRYNQRKAAGIPTGRRQSRASIAGFARVPGIGMMRAQEGAWVPGTGTGDRVPAMLEPGEFVVNKNAAMKYGGLLNQMNFKDAPRFAGGGMLGRVAGISSVGYMLPMIIPMNDAMAKLTYTLTTAIDALQIFAGIKGSGGLKAASKITGLFEKGRLASAAGKAEMQIGKQMIGGAGTAASRRGIVAGAGRVAGGAGSFATGAGRLALGMLMSPVGLAVAGTVGVLALAVIKYRQEIEKSRKASQEAFSAGKDTAAAYGIEIQSINDKLKENQEITNNLGLGKATNVDPNAISADKMAAIKSDNANLIGRLNDSRFDRNPTTNIEKASMLRTKFATLRQQGFSQRDAMEVLTGIAKEAGAETQNVLYSLKPELIKITGDTQAEVFKSAQDAQLQALKSTQITGVVGSSEAFRETFKGIMQTIQFAAPEDQYKALENVLATINSLDATQITQAGKALVEAATADYGSADNFTQALQNLNQNGGAANLATAVSLNTAKRLGIDTGYIETQLKLDLPPAEVAALKAQLDEATKQRSVIINMQLRNSERAQTAIDALNGKISESQAAMDAKLNANDAAVEKENERFKAAAKASAKFIKEKQKEIESINKGAEAYTNVLEKESALEKFRSDQTNTAFGGLSALAQGDVIGFIKAQQEAEQGAREFSVDQELSAIEEKRKASVDALQEQIDKENEKQANADENHQKRLDQLEKERQAAITANAAAVKGLQDQIDQYSSLQSMSGSTYDKIIGNFQYAASEAEKTGAVAAALNYLLSNPTATIDQAIAEGQKYLTGNVNFETARETRRLTKANGGYISGAGGPTEDKIPAMLSNGEYVVRASAVDQYGVGMLDQINTQKFATGGIVNFRGKRFDQSTVNKILLTEQDLKDVFSFYQGSYNKGGVSASAGTHDGGGVFDVKTPLTSEAVSGLRRRGFAAWMRSANIGGVQHIHALEIGNPNLSPAAARQVQDFLGGGDGLKGGSRGGTGAGAGQTDDNAQSVSDSLDQIATAMGTTTAMYNDIKNNGLGTVLTGRRFGGSMTMNKPYVVGENGPEVVMPYGAGGKVIPKFKIAGAAQSVIGAGQSVGDIINTTVGGDTYINLSVNGIHDPNQAARRVMEIINGETNRRQFGRGN